MYLKVSKSPGGLVVMLWCQDLFFVSSLSACSLVLEDGHYKLVCHASNFLRCVVFCTVSAVVTNPIGRENQVTTLK